MITSTQNPKVKEVRALQGQAKARREAGAFVTEGVRLAEEALAAGWRPELALYTEDLSERGLAVVERSREEGVMVEMLAAHVMEAASDTKTPQGLLLVLPMRSLPLPEKLDFVLIVDEVRDPGNLGTMLRTAGAAGVQAAFLTPGTTDVYAPKVVRAGMGAHFRLPLRALEWEQIEEICQAQSMQAYLAAAGEGIPYTEADLTAPVALIIGGEAEGAGEQARGFAQKKIHIPMQGGTESLNAGAAAAILLFEAARQRRSEA